MQAGIGSWNDYAGVSVITRKEIEIGSPANDIRLAILVVVPPTTALQDIFPKIVWLFPTTKKIVSVAPSFSQDQYGQNDHE